MRTIVQKTGGAVSYKEMVDEYLAKRAKRHTKKKTVSKKAAPKKKSSDVSHNKKTGVTKVVLKKNGKLTDAGKAFIKSAKGKKKKSKTIDPGF